MRSEVQESCVEARELLPNGHGDRVLGEAVIQKSYQEGDLFFHVGRSLVTTWNIGRWAEQFIGTYASPFRWDCLLPRIYVRPQEYNDDGSFRIPWWKPQETECGGYFIRGYQFTIQWLLVGAAWTWVMGIVTGDMYAYLDEMGDLIDPEPEPPAITVEAAEFHYELPEEMEELNQAFPAIGDQQYACCTQCTHDDGSTPDEWGCRLEQTQRLSKLYQNAMGGVDYGIAQYCPYFQQIDFFNPTSTQQTEDKFWEAKVKEMDF
jgi:hypothetical protein